MAKKNKVEEPQTHPAQCGSALMEAPEAIPSVPLEDILGEAAKPQVHEKDWSDWVMGQFSPEELVEGRPVVDGLRRVVEACLGPILVSEVELLNAPTRDNDYRAMVRHSMTILWTHTEPGMSAHERTFSEVGEALVGDLPFPVSVASTRAEGRNLRKALRLRKVLAAEEVSSRDNGDSSPDFINSYQKNVIDAICGRLDINAWKFINIGKGKYERCNDVPYHLAVKMISHLQDYQADPQKIPEAIKGYQKGWAAP